MWLDVVGLLTLGLVALWGARVGLIRVLAVLVAVSVAIGAQDLFGAALGTLLASTLDVHPSWAAQTAGRTLTAFAAAGVLALGTALGPVARETPIVGSADRAAGLAASLALGIVAAAWLGTLMAGQPLLNELAGGSRLLILGERCLTLSRCLAHLLLHVLGWAGGTGRTDQAGAKSIEVRVGDRGLAVLSLEAEEGGRYRNCKRPDHGLARVETTVLAARRRALPGVTYGSTTAVARAPDLRCSRVDRIV